MYLAYMMDLLSGAARAISQIKTPPIDVENADEINAILQRHGCTLKEEGNNALLISFPPGTTRKPIGGLGISERYLIRLPDGYIISETYDTMRAVSLLAFPKDIRFEVR
jgi:hypothetical protein